MHKKVILSLCRFVTPKLHEKGTFGRLLEASSAEAASSCKTFGAPKHDPNTCLRDENDILNAKIKELNACKPSTSTIDHVSICIRFTDINVEAIDDHLAMIK
jgi:hypothetical protein